MISIKTNQLSWRFVVLSLTLLATMAKAQVLTSPGIEMTKVGEIMQDIYPVILDSSGELNQQQIISLQEKVKALATHIENAKKQTVNQ
ncbi:MAG: hypothetical protein MI867_26310, partial [Pseudomonadales bacterium]|nr:hypothetical protein [Pseudomonadales bacterium]